MRFAMMDGRAVLLTGERQERVVDVAQRSGGRFANDPAALLADWDALREWAAGLP
ncbi:MAG: fumarylacetoacetate hydrolase, partial [Myxococcales bacterium]|nr:fumarylacetoacetate hydrolase [Myxococcales bacterium]